MGWFQKTNRFLAVLVGEELTYDFANDAYVRLSGGRPLLGLSVREAFPELRGLGYFEVLDGVMVTGRPYVAKQMPVALMRKGRPEARILDFSYEPIFGPDGKPAAILVEGQDVTDHADVDGAKQVQRRESLLVELHDRLRDLDDPADISYAAAELLGTTFNVSRAGYGTIDVARENITIERDWNAPGIRSIAGVLNFRDYGTYIEELKRGETVVCADAFTDPRTSMRAKALKAISAQAFVNMPVSEQGGVVALLYLNHAEARVWTPEELALIREVAERTRVAVERRRAEIALAASMSRFQAAVRAIDGVIWTANAQGMLEDEQPGWTALTGQTHEDYRDGGGMEVLHPDDREATRAAWSASVAERRLFQGEHRLKCADGRWRHFSVRAVPVLDPENTIREWVGVHTDVTEQRQREAELREREERLRAALDASGTGTFRWNIRTGALDWDEALDRLFGLAPGKTARSLDQFLALVHPDDRDEVIARCAACREHGADFEMTFRVVHPSGEVRWLYDKGRTLAGPDGEHATMTGACVDVTERREVEVRLRESESRFRTVAEALPSLVFVANDDGENLYTNATYQTQTGLSAEALNGFGFMQAVHPQDADMVARLWQAARALGRPYEVECRMRMADGAYRWHLGRGLPLAESGGRVRTWFGTINDIQDMVDAREALTRSNLELEAQVSRRTEELAHLQKLEAVGQLTGGIAHDFNNLLTPIIGGLDLLQRNKDLDERASRMVQGALQAAERAKTLVSRLLAFARRQHLDVEVVDLRALVDGIRDLLDRSLGPTITVEIQGSKSLPSVRIDSNQMELALLNLAVNARDAMPDGGRLTIALEAQRLGAEHGSRLPPGDYVRLSVCDTGVGMGEATLARAVEPFFSTKGIGEGTGLGLSMVHGLAAQSGGVLVLSSTPGEGTRAEIYLPVFSGARPEPRHIASGRGAALHGVLVLLVDDDSLVRQTTAEMLESAGCVVRQASSSAEAQAAVAEGLRPDVLISDYLMPGMNGVELGRAMANEVSGLPVLLLSGYSRASQVSEFPRLQKPYRSRDLTDAVAALIRVAEGVA